MARTFPKNRSKRWPVLAPGDIIDIVAPASACKKTELTAGIRYLESLGYRPRVPKNIFSGKSKIFAQTDAERLRQFQKAVRAKDSKAIWCVRGGYGAVRLLPGLNKVRAPNQTKILIGYSDITTLHGLLNGQWGWPTIHGPLLDRFGRGANRPRETRELFGLLEDRVRTLEFSGLKPLNKAAKRSRKLRGSVIGGNLSVLVGSLGTPWQIVPEGHFVFFEDIGEKPHRLDRMLTQLQQAGYFKKAAAVVFGDLLLEDSKLKRLIDQDVIPRFANSLKIPVLCGLPCGHGKVQRPLPFLTYATLQTGKKPRLRVMGAPRL